MRILIVEDEVRLAETLRDLLELEHYTADISHDGESGLDNALSDIYDLVILDVMLPKKDGFSVLRELRPGGKTMAGADAFRPLGAVRPGGGAGLRRGLLSDQAL